MAFVFSIVCEVVIFIRQVRKARRLPCLVSWSVDRVPGGTWGCQDVFT